MLQKLKANAGGLVVCLLEILVGVLLLVDPVSFASGIVIAAGAALLLFGFIRVIRYFRTQPAEAARETWLAQGLLSITAGLFCVMRSEWFLLTLPVLTVLYGAVVLAAGFYKVQLTADMLRMKKKSWGWMAFSSVLSVALAAVILWNPFTSSVFLWEFTAVSLIVEAVFDIGAIFLPIRWGKSSRNSGQEEGRT